MDSVSAAVMACSVALGVAAQEDLVTTVAGPEPREWRQAEVARIERARRAGWARDPVADMRARMKRLG